MIEESEKLKSSLEGKAEHLADRLVPYTLGGTALTYLLTRKDVYKRQICVRIPGSYLASKYFPDTLFLINEKNMQYTAKTTARKHLQTVQKCGIVSMLHFYTNILDKGTDRGV